MQYSFRDRIIALSGIFQATRMVQQVARSGMCEQTPFEASLKSIMTVESSSPEAVYENSANVLTGARTIINQLGNSQQSGNQRDNNRDKKDKNKDIDITKYAVGIMVLERKLMKRQDLLTKITEGIENAKGQLDHFAITHENVVANLANIYSETVSTLNPRIIVNGEHNHIANPTNANKIRALLLAAMRAAVLWRQCGGTRWQLLFNRKAILSEAQAIVSENSAATIH